MFSRESISKLISEPPVSHSATVTIKFVDPATESYGEGLSNKIEGCVVPCLVFKCVLSESVARQIPN